MRLRTAQAAEYLGVHPNTLRSYVRRGLVLCSVNVGGQRLFDKAELDKVLCAGDKESKVVYPVRRVFYVRASDGNRTLINNQISMLTELFGEPTKVIVDKASGLNDDRKGLNRLFKMAELGEIDEVCVTHPDRLTRFGYKYVERILNIHNVAIKVTSTQTRSPEEELLQDFMNLIASFSGKFYHMRGTQNKQKLLTLAQRELANEKQ